MAIVKIHPIKKTPSKGIEYIVNPEKTKDGILVTGINTVADPKLAHIDMKNMRERYSMKRENKCFHFVHSFAFSRMSYSLNHRVYNIVRLASFTY